MSWLFIAVSSYFLSALVIILDKYILSAKKIPSPPVYSFYIGLLGLFAFMFVPFSFSFPPINLLIISLIGGALFTFGILAQYFAIRIGQASRVATFVGAVIPFVTFIISILFLSEDLIGTQIFGALLLMVGGLLVTFDLPLKTNREKFWEKLKYALLAGFLLAVAFLVFKYIYSQQSFLNGFMWTRLGSALAVTSFFLVPSWRKDIWHSLQGFKKPTSAHYHAGALVVLNKVLGGTASLLFNYALALGSVTIINSLIAVQYVFILVLAVIFSRYRPEIYEEKLKFWDWAQKILAIAVIGAGIFLISSNIPFLSP